MESLDELLANQGINLEDGEMSVIEQDGRQYLLLPNVSVAQVLETTANVPVEMPQYSTATLPLVLYLHFFNETNSFVAAYTHSLFSFRYRRPHCPPKVK